jgi:hypothetical protein
LIHHPSALNWKLLTKKRAGVTQGLPPGKEDLEMDYRIVHREKGIKDIHAVGRAVLDGSSNLTGRSYRDPVQRRGGSVPARLRQCPAYLSEWMRRERDEGVESGSLDVG